MTEDEMVGWHHRLNGHEFEQGVGDSERQGRLCVLQSMGGYVSQAFIDLYPGEAAGFVSVDSAPLKSRYYPRWVQGTLKSLL